MITTVLADCTTCLREVEAAIIECDPCLEQDVECEHLACLECGTRLW